MDELEAVRREPTEIFYDKGKHRDKTFSLVLTSVSGVSSQTTKN